MEHNIVLILVYLMLSQCTLFKDETFIQLQIVFSGSDRQSDDVKLRTFDRSNVGDTTSLAFLVQSSR